MCRILHRASCVGLYTGSALQKDRPHQIEHAQDVARSIRRRLLPFVVVVTPAAPPHFKLHRGLPLLVKPAASDRITVRKRLAILRGIWTVLLSRKSWTFFILTVVAVGSPCTLDVYVFVSCCRVSLYHGFFNDIGIYVTFHILALFSPISHHACLIIDGVGAHRTVDCTTHKGCKISETGARRPLFVFTYGEDLYECLFFLDLIMYRVVLYSRLLRYGGYGAR